jgi:hypothetical protein
MRIGLIGPATNRNAQGKKELRKALEFLLVDAEVQQAIYFGVDDSIDAVVGNWAGEIMGGTADEDAFLTRAATLAVEGTPEAIAGLLNADTFARRLGLVRKLPQAPARAIEMLDKWIVLGVHDKAVLDEEDIANADVIVYGKADASHLKRFGPRAFFTPGPLSAGNVGMLELMADGQLEVSVYDLTGTPVWSETLQSRAAKLVVTS